MSGESFPQERRTSCDVRIWEISKYKGKRGTTYTVRWIVDGEKFPQTFSTRKLAETFRSQLVTAARQGVPFDTETGLPEPMARDRASRTWYEVACEYVDETWAGASARHRKSIAESLSAVTLALVSPSAQGAPDTDDLRHLLYSWSFNKAARVADPGRATDPTIKWIGSNTVRMSELVSPNGSASVRRALNALSVLRDGKLAAPRTFARKRASFYSALEYGVEIGQLTFNPIDRIKWTVSHETEAVDRRVVVNPDQARSLLAAVHEIEPALEAFFACMYYAALRPAEVIHLRRENLKLPKKGWGRLELTGSTQQVGTAWGDGEGAKEDRSLKHRGRSDSRPVPACPDLVAALRRHLQKFECGPDGRLFVSRTGRFGRPVSPPYNNPVSTNTYTRVWREARREGLPADRLSSPLAARPYDLRHAAVSLWLNAGVPAPQVAEWAGHSVHVLLKVYAKCIDGEDSAARRRIEAALSLKVDEEERAA